MKIAWRQEMPQLAVIATMFVAAAAVWSAVPDRLPVHWNLQGEVDRYGGKWEGVLLLPLITLGLYWLLLLIPFVDPQQANYQKFQQAYRVIRWCLTMFMTILYGLMLAVAFGQPVDMSLWISTLMAALFIVLGFSLEHVQPNWFVGIRTPWTLSSPLSWSKTHRLAKWVFIAIGFAFLPLGWWKNVWTFAVLLTVAGGGVTGLVVYSYLVWKQDRAAGKNDSGEGS